jgi:geranylgeranyl diphosphate synthase type II
MYSPEELQSLYEQKFSSSNFNENPTGLYDPVKHIMSIKGKRIRPLLLMMSCDLFGGNVQEALHPAFAMEVFHNFTLVHDDIMDNADIRRGIPTVHKLFGVNTGILAGDVMLAYAYKYLTDIPAIHIPELLRIFNKTAIEIFEGQQLDMDFEKRTDVSETEYLKMIEYKTSVLLACSLQLGAVLAGAGEENQKRIYDFGLNLGLAFQIKDDYLDAFGEGEKVGKKIGGDILQNKKTYLLITALHTAKGEQLEALQLLLKNKNEDEKIAGVKNLFDSLGVKAITENRMNQLYAKAIESLKAVDVEEPRKELLLKLAKAVHERDF